ncbi:MULTISPECIES: hypothetical protein [unclassified Shinella]|uniref:hypothetical protein n=1 Tax=unclassified Shinella TaxID=2643062 RepID=UPI00234ED3B6|nr:MULTISPECIES: hypothetical protein [unclassified Shinella]MCO5152059.1 hypothetical protein [Shinella sp.]MDC7266612.1 hypothetical protein [Shinella sp. HY16]MDC7273509.1 hypothetical protein [Shinella sp. YZ44]
MASKSCATECVTLPFAGVDLVGIAAASDAFTLVARVSMTFTGHMPHAWARRR